MRTKFLVFVVLVFTLVLSACGAKPVPTIKILSVPFWNDEKGAGVQIEVTLENGAQMEEVPFEFYTDGVLTDTGFLKEGPQMIGKEPTISNFELRIFGEPSAFGKDGIVSDSKLKLLQQIP